MIATTGQSDPTTYSQVELAQLKMEDFTKYPAFNGNVSVVDAKSFWIPVSSSPADEGYHWNRNAKSYYMIGDALAGEMLGLQPDTTPPSPDPMSFATPPAALGQTSITMTATTASDPSGVEYFFECTAGGGHSSAWQDSPTYTDTGLTAATQYSYRVRARDKSAAQAATAWSAAASATTAPDTTAPTPDPMTFATPPAALGETSITMTATTASDPSGVEYFFECTAGGGHSSAWQDSPTYTDTGLTAATQYGYRVRARDKSAAQTATEWSATISATTAPDTTAPTPDPLTFATPPAALGETSITMTAATATDPSGVEYFFECTAGGGHSSVWQDSPIYTDTGLTAATQYGYRVRARDKSAAQTATAWSTLAAPPRPTHLTAPGPAVPRSMPTPTATVWTMAWRGC